MATLYVPKQPNIINIYIRRDNKIYNVISDYEFKGGKLPKLERVQTGDVITTSIEFTELQLPNKNLILIVTPDDYLIYDSGNLHWLSPTMNVNAKVMIVSHLVVNPNLERQATDFLSLHSLLYNSIEVVDAYLKQQNVLSVVTLNGRAVFTFFPQSDQQVIGRYNILSSPIIQKGQLSTIPCQPIGLIFADGGIGILQIISNGTVIARGDVNKSSLVGYQIVSERPDDKPVSRSIKERLDLLITEQKSLDELNRDQLNLALIDNDQDLSNGYGFILYDMIIDVLDLKFDGWLRPGADEYIFLFRPVVPISEWYHLKDLYLMVSDTNFYWVAGLPPRMTLLSMSSSNYNPDEVIRKSSHETYLPDTSRFLHSTLFVQRITISSGKALNITGIPLKRLVKTTDIEQMLGEMKI